jgi:hypothetical protein
MLHMQHAHVVALLVRQHEAARLKAQRDAIAKARRTAAAAEQPETQPATTRRGRKVHRPRPA